MLKLYVLVNNGWVVVMPVGPLVLWSVCKIVSAFLTAWIVSKLLIGKRKCFVDACMTKEEISYLTYALEISQGIEEGKESIGGKAPGKIVLTFSMCILVKEGKENIGGKGSRADSLSFLKCLNMEKIVTIIFLLPYYILMSIGFVHCYIEL